MSLSRAKRKVDQEHWQFKKKWTCDSFFINGASTCLICEEEIAVLKGFNVKPHYTTRHQSLKLVTGEANSVTEAGYRTSE